MRSGTATHHRKPGSGRSRHRSALDGLDPATGQPVGKVPDASGGDLDRALDAAQPGFTNWSKVAAGARASALDRTAAPPRGAPLSWPADAPERCRPSA
ncbi:aldehyde dehydrogenase family protein [Burkholderia plantarii]|uniref:aldehyde dehydrogenase family protein n=1 Tax=Burkholderia plantarii TaxID=41899 RepID=UPI0018DE6102|nr:aldehyde dehydrogenase family protein [Burkholderia plantarii]MBI0331791.1 aldehyde dehydrogenase family protein [Burkholderia plantarii]